MKRLVAGALTVALMALLIWTGRGRTGSGSGSDPGAESRAGAGTTESTTFRSTPDPAEARLTTLLDAAWRGDVPAYLDCFRGPLRERLEREIAERGRDVFAADLRNAARARKSHAIFGVEPEGEGAARIKIETVYPDRNEHQTYHLVQAESGGDWLVSDVETIRGQVPRAKFGTPASYQEPEGVPVQGQAPPVQGVPLRVETETEPGLAGETGTNP